MIIEDETMVSQIKEEAKLYVESDQLILLKMTHQVDFKMRLKASGHVRDWKKLISLSITK